LSPRSAACHNLRGLWWPLSRECLDIGGIRGTRFLQSPQLSRHSSSDKFAEGTQKRFDPQSLDTPCCVGRRSGRPADLGVLGSSNCNEVAVCHPHPNGRTHAGFRVLTLITGGKVHGMERYDDVMAVHRLRADQSNRCD
jgi:hypothetical protein